ELMAGLPGCWAKVTAGDAPLWQARRIAQACAELDDTQRGTVDAGVAPALGASGMNTLMRTVNAQVMAAKPAIALRRAEQLKTRYVHTWAEDIDPLTGCLSARLGRADAEFLDATVQMLADLLASQGEAGTQDERRAKALGMLANPAAVVELIGVHTTRGMDPAPQTQADVQAIIGYAKTLAPKLTPRTRVFVHLYSEDLDGVAGVARAEQIGPILLEQVKQLTGATRVKLTPVINTAATIAVDGYEIPTRIRQTVLARSPHDMFPWSSIEARYLMDADHTIAWTPGADAQTSTCNLAFLNRAAHNAKSYCGWRLLQLWPGLCLWISPAGQAFRVDQTGTHPVTVLK
ncbi:MAG: hypothetical protein FWF75_08765, partial [Propionibacteriaceae bacterium]|nr:hypothetical protein [Propionibacteriaceae bacterium]